MATKLAHVEGAKEITQRLARYLRSSEECADQLPAVLNAIRLLSQLRLNAEAGGVEVDKDYLTRAKAMQKSLLQTCSADASRSPFARSELRARAEDERQAARGYFKRFGMLLREGDCPNAMASFLRGRGHHALAQFIEYNLLDEAGDSSETKRRLERLTRFAADTCGGEERDRPRAIPERYIKYGKGRPKAGPGRLEVETPPGWEERIRIYEAERRRRWAEEGGGLLQPPPDYLTTEQVERMIADMRERMKYRWAGETFIPGRWIGLLPEFKHLEEREQTEREQFWHFTGAPKRRRRRRQRLFR